MKRIPLTQGLYALVDDEDYEYLSRHKWYASKEGNMYYAKRYVYLGNGKGTSVKMHQGLLGKKPVFVIDHKDGNGLNNQKSNLRHVTRRQNAQNLFISKTSKYPGVYWNKRMQKWDARIRVNGKRRFLGLFADEYEAFLAYKNAVLRYAGEEVVSV
jgi:hypothetical protein